jgi:hypothetical protein
MERIDPVGPWLTGVPPAGRTPAPERVGEESGRRPADEQRRRREEAEDDVDDDGQPHVDVSA